MTFASFDQPSLGISDNFEQSRNFTHTHTQTEEEGGKRKALWGERREARGEKVGPEGPGVGMPPGAEKHENQENTPPDHDFAPFDHGSLAMIRRFA